MGITAPAALPPLAYQRPTPIRPDHRFATFRSGQAELDLWLQKHALGNEGRVSRTYVVTNGDDLVVAYYALANGDMERRELPRRLRHDSPTKIPILVLGRLAVDQQHSARGLGSHMLKEAMLRTLDVSRISAVRALVVHAISAEAVEFYVRYGFQISPTNPYTLLLPIETLQELVMQS